MISIIAAMTYDGLIGVNNRLPWHVPSDLKRFKELTTGNIVIMGRKTYESISPPLRNRTVVVVTKHPDYAVVNGYSTRNISKTINRYRNDNIFIIGGGEIYEQTLDLADRLYITIIKQDIKLKKSDAPVYFPAYNPKDWGLYYHEQSDISDYIIWNRIKEDLTNQVN